MSYNLRHGVLPQWVCSINFKSSTTHTHTHTIITLEHGWMAITEIHLWTHKFKEADTTQVARIRPKCKERFQDAQTYLQAQIMQASSEIAALVVRLYHVGIQVNRQSDIPSLSLLPGKYFIPTYSLFLADQLCWKEHYFILNVAWKEWTNKLCLPEIHFNLYNIRHNTTVLSTRPSTGTGTGLIMFFASLIAWHIPGACFRGRKRGYIIHTYFFVRSFRLITMLSDVG